VHNGFIINRTDYGLGKPVLKAHIESTPPNATVANHIPPIVGIGSSAGGLEALEDFFTHIPALSGLAFVVVQHLDPMHKSILPELLQRMTPMLVKLAGNRMKVKPNCVYVIPPNKDISILHGLLYLLDPVAPRGLRLPIDFFFHSLADDLRQRAVAVILSGMGSDGTLGLRAIKENAGLTLVQSPETAKFDGMPRSAINASLADIVASAQALPARIFAYLKHAPRGVSLGPIPEIKSSSALSQVVILLRGRTGNDFSLYKKNTIYRRIERRMSLHQIETIALYARYLRENPQELDLLFKELLIGVTNFFRDQAVWEQLIKEALPALFAEYPAGRDLRAWVTACSTGEEAYSLAMAFKEALDNIKPHGRFTLQIFATDLDEDAISLARLGLYSANIEANVPPECLTRYFAKEASGYRINKEIREMVIFAPQNIVMDPPFTKLDILTCRNLLIYLGPELQKRLIPLFHYALARHGILLLGNAETIGNYTQLFSQTDSKSRIYHRMDNPKPLIDVDFPSRLFPMIASEEDNLLKVTPMNNQTINLQALADQVLLQNFAPAAVLINAEGDILYINGRTGKYLEPAAGKANWNIYAMAREGLRHELGLGIKKAQTQAEVVQFSGLTVGTQGVNLSVQAIGNPEALRGSLIVVFTDVATPVKAVRRTAVIAQKELLRELQQAREQIQTMREEMQSSQEELKSTNEEMQSTNEELQSTNEELTTSKEGMQSLNEELQTVNAELQSKVDDLSWVNNDMKNLLNSTEIATVFLDNALNVRRFTTHCTQLFKLIAGDVGRPLSDIVMDLDYANLQQDANEVLRSLAFIEKQVATKDGRWFKVRIMPYRTQDNVIDGVVITFADISNFKALEAELRKIRP
jgi:two-component system CheB/CheR fusion protein